MSKKVAIRLVTAEELTPAQRVRVQRKARDVKAGRVHLPPLRCGYCASSTLVQDLDYRDQLKCVSCGRSTPRAGAHAVRRQEIRALIMEAV